VPPLPVPQVPRPEDLPRGPSDRPADDLLDWLLG
jgi:hypothetical protein